MNVFVHGGLYSTYPFCCLFGVRYECSIAAILDLYTTGTILFFGAAQRAGDHLLAKGGGLFGHRMFTVVSRRSSLLVPKLARLLCPDVYTVGCIVALSYTLRRWSSGPVW